MTSVGFRIPPTIRFLVVWFALNIRAENVEIVTPESSKILEEQPKNVTVASDDSYMRAYDEVQKLRLGPAERNDFSDPPDKDKEDYNTVIRSSYLSDDKYPSLTNYFPPSPSPPVSPAPVYGPPHSPPVSSSPIYGPPHSHHELPSPTLVHYGPPHSHHHHEYPAPHHCHTIPYSSPSTSLFGFLPKKLSLKLLLKILLKLVLFKMIVKFIAVICLLLFVPALKSKEASAENDDERRKSREIDVMSNLIWGSIENKNSLFTEDGEVKDIEEIAQEADEDDNDEDNYFSGPIKAVRFLEFCVNTVDRVVGFIMGILNRQNNKGDDLSGFILEKIGNFVKSL